MSTESDVTFGEVYSFLTRGAWLAILAAATAGVAAFLYAERQAPVFEASARVLTGSLATGARPAVTDPEVLVLAATSQEVMQSALALLSGAAVDQAAATDLRDRTDARYLTGTTNRVIEVVVTGSDPQQTEREVQAVVRALIDWEEDQARRAAANSAQTAFQRLAMIEIEVSRIESAAPASPELARLIELREQVRREALQSQAIATAPSSTLQLFDSAQPPAAQVGPRPTYMAVLAAVAGAIVGYTLFLILERSDRRLRTVDSLRRLTDARVIEVAHRRRDRTKPLDRAAASVAAALWNLNRSQDPGPLRVAITALERTPATNGFAVSLVERLASEGVSTLLLLPDTKPTLTRTQPSGPPKAPVGPGPYVSVGLDVPRRITESSLEVIRNSAPSSAWYLMPRALESWLRIEAGEHDVVVLPLSPAGTALPPPAIAAGSIVVLIVPLTASKSEATAMLNSIARLGKEVVAVLALHPSATKDRRRASEASRVIGEPRQARS